MMKEHRTLDPEVVQKVEGTNTLRILRAEKSKFPLYNPLRTVFNHVRRLGKSADEPDTTSPVEAPTFSTTKNKHVETTTTISQDGLATKADDILPKEAPDLS